MNKNIFKISLIIICPLIIFGAFYLVAQSKTINPIIITSNTNDGYSYENGLETIAKIVVPAVENYASQDASESISSRTNRLSLYFAGGSPVYSYSQKNIGSLVDKSMAKVLSVKNSESEGEDLNLEVQVDITSYKNKKASTKSQTYWITLIKIYDGSMTPYDIGEVNL